MVELLRRAPGFRWVVAIQVVPVLPARLTDDTTATSTRDKKAASHATARPAPRVRREGGGHDGALVLIARAGSLVRCVTPRGAEAI